LTCASVVTPFTYWFCSGHVPSFDGVPLDVDLTLPDGALVVRPLLVMLHGYSNDKTEWESNSVTGGKPDKDGYNNLSFASRGYAVLNYTARGFKGSCGPGTLDAGCARGWTHLADRRFEVRDTQYLVGLLVDAGVADPSHLGVTGGSYGGGQSMLLALQGNRVTVVPEPLNPATYGNARLVPWTSPNGVALQLAAAVPKYPWSDLVHSLVPNGRASDGVILADRNRLHPLGIEKESLVSYLYFFGNAPTGYYAPPGADPTADLTSWFARLQAGEPYGGDPAVKAAIDQLRIWRSPFYQDRLIATATTRVPILDLQGWTDELFPEVEGVAMVDKLRAAGWPAGISLADVGHPIAQNKSADWSVLNERANEFLDYYLLGSGGAPSLDLRARVSTCDSTVGDKYAGSSWPAIAPGRFPFSSTAPGATASGAPDPAGALTDPIGVAARHGGNGSCITLSSLSTTGTAVWDFPVTTTFTLLGEPALHLDATVAGVDAEVNSRLWDVGPDGMATLVTRGAYRFTGTAGLVSINTALQGNGWVFAAGHTIRLQVTQVDTPYLRPDSLPSSIVYSGVALTLPAT
jgi:acetyl esterase/lipase